MARASALLLGLAFLGAPACGDGPAAGGCGQLAPGIVLTASIAYVCSVIDHGPYVGTAIFVMSPGSPSARRLTGSLVRDSDPAWSPDGASVAFASTRDGGSNLYVMRADGSAVRRLTGGPASDSAPAWSPDGSRIVFASGRGGIHGSLGPLGIRANLYVVTAGGAGLTRLTGAPGFDGDPAWSPDGRRIAFVSDRPGSGASVYVMDLDGGSVRRLTHDGGVDRRPAWSPDGKWIAFDRTPAPGVPSSGGSILAVPASGSGEERWMASPGYAPAWSSDGSGIAFVSSRSGIPALLLLRLSTGRTALLVSGGRLEGRPALQPAPR